LGPSAFLIFAALRAWNLVVMLDAKTSDCR
jgi:hypothetical protein